MPEQISLLPLTNAEKAALLTAVTMVLQSMKVQPLDPIGTAVMAAIKPPLESVSEKLKQREVKK